MSNIINGYLNQFRPVQFEKRESVRYGAGSAEAVIFLAGALAIHGVSKAVDKFDRLLGG